MAIHFAVDVLVDVIKACLIRLKLMAKLVEVFLRHECLKRRQLLLLDQTVEVEADNLLVQAVKVFIEKAAAILSTPGRREKTNAVEALLGMLASLAEVQTKNVGAKADSVSVETSAGFARLWIAHVATV